MLIDDIIYTLILLACIGFGPIFRSIKNPIAKQWISTCVGFAIVTIVSGWYVVHPFLITIGNAAIISLASRRIRHLANFYFSFLYLLVIFRLSNWYGIPIAPTHTNLILMIMTLRYGGLGYELNSTEEELKNDPDNGNYRAITKVGFLDVMHYGFSYMGVLTGPFYRYRTYWDCINQNLGNYIDCWGATLHKLKLIFGMIVIYLVFNYYFNSEYVLTEEFLKRSFLYRIWYIYPAVMVFRARLFSGMLFSECVCQMAGMGIYPSITETRTGHGPKNYKAYTQIVSDPNKLKNERMDFETIHNMNIWEVETCYTARIATKNWNKTVQYWLANYVYKTFPIKALKVPAVFFLSSVWHGYAFGYYMAIFSLVFYFALEDIYVKFYNTINEGSIAKKILLVMLTWFRFSTFTYLAFSMLLLTHDKIFTYYNSVYWIGHIIGIILYVIGIILTIIVTPKKMSKVK